MGILSEIKRSKSLGNGKNWNPVLIHCLVWSLFIGYEVFYIYILSGSLNNPLSYVVNYILNISLFYVNALVVLPYLVNNRKWEWYLIGLAIIFEIIVFVIIKYPANLLVLGSSIQLKTSQEFKTYALANTLRAFHYLALSTAYFLTALNVRRTREIADLETQRLVQHTEAILLQKDLLQSRNAYLRAQVNPHLLFNTLNFLYNFSARVSKQLADAVMTLSDIMRYALATVDDDDKVPLEKEIDHIKNYIKLNQIRFDQQLNIHFVQEGHTDDKRIIPLALITLVENVFKYGDLRKPGAPAIIRLTIAAKSIIFQTYNLKRANHRSFGHGTGLGNLRERLDIYYANRYSLRISDNEDSFSLTLNLTLTD